LEKKEAGRGEVLMDSGSGRGEGRKVERVGKRKGLERGEGWMAERVGKGRGLRGRLGNKRCDVKRNCLTRQVADIKNKFPRTGSAEILVKSSTVPTETALVFFSFYIPVLARIIMIQ
jgi:hypothetical protein